MDTSETYIKMCEKAEEIARTYNWELGDYWWDGYQIHINPKADFPYVSSTITRLIWLPRQDQLQEMYQDWSKLDFRHMLNAFCLAVEKYPILSYDSEGILKIGLGLGFAPTSMEQLWLAFVMKEKYNKTWSGEGWIDGR